MILVFGAVNCLGDLMGKKKKDEAKLQNCVWLDTLMKHCMNVKYLCLVCKKKNMLHDFVATPLYIIKQTGTLLLIQ